MSINKTPHAYYMLPLKAHELRPYSVADKHRLKTIFTLLAGPILPEGDVLTVLINKLEQTGEIETYSTLSSHKTLKDEDRKELLRLGALLFGAHKVDYTSARPQIVVFSREMTSHEVLQEREEIKSICVKAGLNWSQIGTSYDDLVAKYHPRAA